MNWRFLKNCSLSFIKCIKKDGKWGMYTENDLVRVAKRENNNKRKYLVVNRLQAKHVPADPEETIKMFDALAEVVKKEYEGKKLLLVGFAETATAIGARLAIELDSYYMQTTRENIADAAYLYFTESHSHATEQKLVKTDLDQVIEEIDRIVFVEDEVTTGNTIMKIINIIKSTYNKAVHFAVASLLNGMDDAARKIYEDADINIHYLVKTDHSSYTEIAEKFRGDGVYHTRMSRDEKSELELDGKQDGELGRRPDEKLEIKLDFKQKFLDKYVNGRRLNRGRAYEQACNELWNQVKKTFPGKQGNSVLVVGTEEFMYPAIAVAYQLKKEGYFVKCHATTRSPIVVSMEQDYPLHCRYELESVYEKGRTTFLYDIEKYDEVIILTDSSECGSGMTDLVNAIKSKGNSSISIYRWCES